MAQEARNLATLHLPQAETWIIEDNGEPLGFIALLGDEIGGLFVDPSRHGEGLGRRLVDHAMARTGRLSVDVFEKNAIGLSFYDQYGFVETRCYRHTESGEMMLRLELRGAD